jgi:hypothetical protein
MVDELERILNETVVTWLISYPVICVDELKKNTK